MATIAEPRRAAGGDEGFFLTMAIVTAAVLVGGFAFNLAMGRSSFAVPPIFHVHAFLFFGWILIFVTQNALAASGAIEIHRRLGWVAAVWVPAMVAMGLAITLYAVRDPGRPPFFYLPEFLIGNPLGILCFAGLVAAAIRMRRATDWHRRLMCGAMISITGPGFGRLLPAPLLIPWAWWAAAFICPMIVLAAAAFFDPRRAASGRVHPAWLWTGAAMTATIAITDLIAFSPLGAPLARAVVAGSPAAGQDFAPHFP